MWEVRATQAAEGKKQQATSNKQKATADPSTATRAIAPVDGREGQFALRAESKGARVSARDDGLVFGSVYKRQRQRATGEHDSSGKRRLQLATATANTCRPEDRRYKRQNLTAKDGGRLQGYCLRYCWISFW
jgi:hypothetical protein